VLVDCLIVDKSAILIGKFFLKNTEVGGHRGQKQAAIDREGKIERGRVGGG
jgi:hypothetical protein